MLRSLLLIPLTVIALAACSASATPVPSPVAVRLDESANGTTVTVAPGTPIILELASNATTGYTWLPTTLPDDARVAMDEPAGGTYVAPSAEPGLTGAGGTHAWTFTAVAAGTTDLGLGYVRPWESGVAPIEMFAVTFVVK